MKCGCDKIHFAQVLVKGVDSIKDSWFKTFFLLWIIKKRIYSYFITVVFTISSKAKKEFESYSIYDRLGNFYRNWFCY